LNIPNLGYIIPNMGAKSKGLGEVLFTKSQRRVLGLLFGNPDKSFYANEIVRLAETGTGTIHRELERLESAHLLSSKKIGNQKHYQANREAPIFAEIRNIVLKTFGVADPLQAALAPLSDRIRAAFIFGSVARGADTAQSDIDLMIISDEVTYPAVIEALANAQNSVVRSINPVIYGNDEFRRKIASDRGFLQDVIEKPKIFLFGSEDDLPKPR
jgi:predicted nucleotidyltransferase